MCDGAAAHRDVSSAIKASQPASTLHSGSQVNDWLIKDRFIKGFDWSLNTVAQVK